MFSSGSRLKRCALGPNLGCWKPNVFNFATRCTLPSAHCDRSLCRRPFGGFIKTVGKCSSMFKPTQGFHSHWARIQSHKVRVSQTNPAKSIYFLHFFGFVSEDLFPHLISLPKRNNWQYGNIFDLLAFMGNRALATEFLPIHIMTKHVVTNMHFIINPLLKLFASVLCFPPPSLLQHLRPRCRSVCCSQE